MTNHTQINADSPMPVGVCALLFNQYGQILVGQRKNSYGADKDGFPGGRLELHEPLLTGIIREVKEETDLTITNLQFVGVVREAQVDYDFIHFVYAATGITQPPQLCEPEKCEGWRWCDIDSVMDNLLSGHQKALQLYQNKSILIDDIKDVQ